MKRTLHILIPLATIAIATLVIYYISNNAPEAQRRQENKQDNRPVVSLLELQPKHIRLPVIVYGTVAAGEQTQLTAQVRGQVKHINPALNSGLSFKKGEVLVRQDRARLQAAYNIAQAEQDKAEAQLQEEQARARQALENWKITGNSNAPDPLVLRKPQVAIAKANVTTANNRLKQAYYDLAASTIRAPFDGITLERQTNIAEYLTVGNRLAIIMSKNYHKIRLALDGNQLEQVDFSEDSKEQIQIQARIGQQNHQYTGRIIATEAQLDVNTRQFYLVVHIAKPFDYPQPLYPGQYVQVRLPGKSIANVFSIPLSAIDQDDRVAIRKSGRLHRQEITILSSSQDSAIVSGLQAGSALITSSHGNIIEGSKVFTAEEKASSSAEQKLGKQENNKATTSGQK